MKQIPSALKAALGKPGTSTCFLVKIVDADNNAYGFTTLDTDVKDFNDGEHTLTYEAHQELRPQNIQQESSFETDNTDLAGWFDTVVEQLALSGRFDAAQLTIYRLAYLRKDAGVEVVAYGYVGEISLSQDNSGKREVEYRGLTSQLQHKTIALYSITCRAQFGDSRCGMPFVWENATVSEATDNPHLVFTVSGPVRPDDYFNLGIVEFLTGQNAGATLEIESWKATGEIKLAFLAPYPIAPGDTVRLRQDCDKTAATCKAYGNILNMRAEHLTPVEQQAIMVPGANIKAVGAK